MAKRGRPKSDRPKVDYGTPELIAKRVGLSPQDPSCSTTPLDALKSRGQVSAEAHSAAMYFHALRKIVFGKAHPAAIDLTAISAGGMPDELDRATAERKYREACQSVGRHGRFCLDALENVVVHERWPAWMFAGRGKRVIEQRYFELALAALLGWYRGKDRRAA